MQVDYRYQGHSTIATAAGSQQVRLAANLARDVVSFNGTFLHPLRFREAISALHDVVIADLQYQPRDKAAYLEWKAQQQKRETALRRSVYQAEIATHAAVHGTVSPQLEREHAACAKDYWQARQRFQNQLAREDMTLWQRLFPLDPVVTVAEDAVFFEVFSQDESSYACLTCDRDNCFASADDVSLGTTNIDYSWDLYDHFQTLRSYRQARLSIDATGVTAETEDSGLRMDKIDLPKSWLAGFLQVQAAMTMANTRIQLSPDAVYSLLAWLKRHRARQSPRAIRFELTPGQPAKLVLEPWEQVIQSCGAAYSGVEPQTVRVWGRRRLLALARLLPLLQSVDVYLLGTGLPSFWVAKLGEMRLTLGLSGWTANDWTGSSALDALLPPVPVDQKTAADVAAGLQSRRQATLDELCPAGGDARMASAVLMQLARSGQAIYDLDAAVFRWRQILPTSVDWQQLTDESPERAGASEIAQRRQVQITSREESDTEPKGPVRKFIGRSGGRDVEIRVDADGRLVGGKCNCSHHFRNGLRKGPCRHLLAMHVACATSSDVPTPSGSLWDRLAR